MTNPPPSPLFFFFVFKIIYLFVCLLLTYNWSTMLYSYHCTANWSIYAFFFIFFSIMVYPRIWNRVPFVYAATAAKLLQSCLTLCDPIDGSPPGSPIPGILQARTLEWVAISFSNAGEWKVKVKSLSHVRLLVTPWTAAYQAPPSMGFSRQEYWSGVPLPSPPFVYRKTLLFTHSIYNTCIH